MIINPTLPYGFVIFSDDLRQEVTGKTTIVGAYGQQLMFHAKPPASLAQLTVSTWYRFAPNEAPSTLEFRLMFENESGEETQLNNFKHDLSNEQVGESPARTKDPHAQQFIEVRHIAQLQALTFAEPGRLKVRVYSADDEIRIGSLWIGFDGGEEDNET